MEGSGNKQVMTEQGVEGSAPVGGDAKYAREERERRIANGWLAFYVVFFLGPAMAGVTYWMSELVNDLAAHQVHPSQIIFDLWHRILTAYMLGLPGSFAVGLYVGLRVGSNGRLSLYEIPLAAVFITLVYSLILAFGLSHKPGTESLFSLVAPSALFVFLAPTLGSGAVIGWALWRLGIVKRRQ